MNKEIVINLNQLDEYLRKINTLFPAMDMIDKNISHESIVNYYRNSLAIYKYIHSYQGSVHMALNYDGRFSRKGFFTQLHEIIELIHTTKAKNVLELGCGKGFNSIFLAKKLPDIKFSGIDITDEHLKIAHRKSRHIKNLNFTHGDFHQLNYDHDSFDLIFELEAICHAEDSQKVLSEVYRTLKKEGQFVVYDGFRHDGFDHLPNNLIQAAIITEKALAVNRFEKIDIWMEMACREGFKLKWEKDLSKAIMPNLGKLQVLARKYFENPFLSKMFLKIFTRYTTLNCIAVLLMPFTMHNKAHGYFNIILEK
jgi:ubiquinone/menaquinone biosynthesis C-methylase UbiE